MSNEKELATLREENDKLRYLLANSNEPCVYCQLPKAEMAKCRSGFPGCGRMDDLLLGMEAGYAKLELEERPGETQQPGPEVAGG